ncbi:MAG: hypothetical protein KGZ83_10735 [Sulfuricella sp.]|nr:hypothetical protein [Sulfuricella sp.]
MNAYTIRPAVAADTPAILAAFAQTFPSRRSREEWEWLYRHNPDGSQGMLCIAADGRLAAHCGASLHRLRRDGEILVIGQNRDAFSHPAHRAVQAGRGGLFVKTARALFETWGAEQGVNFYYGFPSPRHLRLGEKLLDYRAGRNWGRYRFDTRQPLPPLGAASGRVANITTFDAEFDRLDQARPQPLAIVHDSRFLGWRFAPRGGRRYWVWGFYPHLSGKLAGYVVFAPSAGRAALVDFHFPVAPRDYRSFWALIVAKLRWQGVTDIETWYSHHHPDHRKLLDLGFAALPLPEHTAFCFRLYPQSPSLDELDQRFSFTMADCDLH